MEASHTFISTIRPNQPKDHMNLKLLLAAGCVKGKVVGWTKDLVFIFQYVIGQNLVTESRSFMLSLGNIQPRVVPPRPAAPQAAAMDMAIPMKKSTKHPAKRYGKKPVKSYLRAAQFVEESLNQIGCPSLKDILK